MQSSDIGVTIEARNEVEEEIIGCINRNEIDS